MHNKHKYHDFDLSASSFLITGGAGFIGSHVVDYLITHKAGLVRVLDNLSTGNIKNIEHNLNLPNFEFIEGDIRNFELVNKCITGIDFISHQAALGSVPRSIKDPITTNEVNISGFLNILSASKESNQLKRLVYAASSSTYGDNQRLPKIENEIGSPISPYAITKAVNELYAEVFYKTYNFQSIGLRYFNVFGPRQNPNGEYAAVIPLFCKHFIEDTRPIINGDGETSRDFTYIQNAVQANIKALFNKQIKTHEIFNIACGARTTLSQIILELNFISEKKEIKPIFKIERIGDIKHSLANIEKAKRLLNYMPMIETKQGIRLTYNWYLENQKFF